MKKIFLVLICLTWVVGAFAQQEQAKNTRAKQRVEAQRIGFITQRLDLTPEEAQQFWPIYNQYTEKLQQVPKVPKPKQSPDEMSDVDTEKLILAQMDRAANILELRKEYYSKLKTAISPKKIAKLYKAERDFAADLLKQLQELREKKKGVKKE